MSDGRLGPGDLIAMDEAAIAAIPARDLALIFDDLDHWQAQLDRLRAAATDVALVRLKDDEDRARTEPYGDVTFGVDGTDRTFTVMRLRKVEWNKATLSRLAPQIEDKRGAIIKRKSTLSISEEKLATLTPEKRRLAEMAATTTPGKVLVRCNPKED
ncbi:hypothetical protein LCM08_06390 [Salipiger pacificus]|nr:hypothetical protein [Alloyangia pacifica]